MLAKRHNLVLASAPAVGCNWSDALEPDLRYHDQELGTEVTYRVHRVALGMVLMYGAGLISALLGIGSTFSKFPLWIRRCDCPSKFLRRHPIS
jgi:hypothetical protein